jgi:hypothetical protein
MTTLAVSQSVEREASTGRTLDNLSDENESESRRRAQRSRNILGFDDNINPERRSDDISCHPDARKSLKSLTVS